MIVLTNFQVASYSVGGDTSFDPFTSIVTVFGEFVEMMRRVKGHA